MTLPSVLVYRDKLFMGSESFIPRNYHGFTRLRPVYVGHQKAGQTPPGSQALKIRDFYTCPAPEEIAFKQLGRIPENLLQSLHRENPCILHAHFGKSGAYALPLADALGLPLVTTFHGGDVTKKTHQTPYPWKVYNRRRARLFQKSTRLIAVSDFIRQRLLRLGAEDQKIRVHHLGVDTDRFQPGQKSKTLIFAGRMVEKKGLDLLTEALMRSGEGLQGWTVRFLGTGPLKDKAQKALYHAGIEVDFPGWIPADDMRRHLAEASLVVIPSRMASSGDCEGLPVIALEAMASGAAVLASRHAGLPEAVLHEETGLLFEEGDVDGLTRALRALLQAPEKTRAMGREGRERVKKHFNQTLQARGLEDMLLEMSRHGHT